jgi:hypothetical protein
MTGKALGLLVAAALCAVIAMISVAQSQSATARGESLRTTTPWLCELDQPTTAAEGFALSDGCEMALSQQVSAQKDADATHTWGIVRAIFFFIGAGVLAIVGFRMPKRRTH